MNPQIENGYTRTANELSEAIMKLPVGGYNHRIIQAIIRKTYGFGKTTDYIALSQITELTGIAKTHISRNIKNLIEMQIVTKNGNSLGINKNYSAWKVTKKDKGGKLPKMVMAVTKIGNKKLPNMALQKKKETITKEIILTNVSSDKSLNKLITLFKNLNPNYERLYKNKTQREALQRQVNKFTYEKIENLLNQLPDIVKNQYAPQITTPLQLEEKMGKLILYMQRKQKEVKSVDATKILHSKSGEGRDNSDTRGIFIGEGSIASGGKSSVV